MSKRYLLIFLIGIMVPILFIVGNKQIEAEKYPLLARSQTSEQTSQPNLYFLSGKINSYFRHNKIDHSYYLEYLESGTSAESNSETQVQAASLMKLPYVMDLYFLAERKKINLDKKVAIEQRWIDKSFGRLWQKGEGSKISLREAARLAIVESDNTAVNIVVHFIQNENKSNSSMAKVGKPPVFKDGKAYLSSRDFAAYVKCLYFACYLSKDNSQLILDQMSRTAFGGIPDGTPRSVKVAHKIGVTKDSFSDCGIVYYPDHPYVLCVMVKRQPKEAEKIVKEISSITYRELDSSAKNSRTDPSIGLLRRPY